MEEHGFDPDNTKVYVDYLITISKNFTSCIMSAPGIHSLITK